MMLCQLHPQRTTEALLETPMRTASRTCHVGGDGGDNDETGSQQEGSRASHQHCPVPGKAGHPQAHPSEGLPLQVQLLLPEAPSLRRDAPPHECRGIMEPVCMHASEDCRFGQCAGLLKCRVLP